MAQPSVPVQVLLNDYTDTLSSLPTELTRSFSDLRELDAVLRCKSIHRFAAGYYSCKLFSVSLHRVHHPQDHAPHITHRERGGFSIRAVDTHP